MPALKRFLPLLILLGFASPALAQGIGPAVISLVDPSAFPEVALTVAVSDETGGHVPDLTESAFTVLEDGAPVSGLSVSEVELGTQVVFVLNPADSFRRRDSSGLTRMDHFKQSLTAWIESELATRPGVDRVTLIAPEGPLVSHAERAAEVLTALRAYESSYTGAETPIDLLQQGLDFALDPAPRPGMRRVLVFVSSAIHPIPEAQLNDLGMRARDAHVPVFTVYVGPEGSQATAGAENILAIAAAAAGIHAYFDTAADEALQPIYTFIAGQRAQYRIVYRSRAATSGAHGLSVRVVTGATTAETPRAEFSISLLPASVAFDGLRRDFALPAQTAASPSAMDSLPVRLKVEFPDGHPRELAGSALFVDGQIVAENTAPPFDGFDWDLSRLAAPGEHRLLAVVVDELGVQAQSDEAVVTVSAPISTPVGLGPVAAALPRPPAWALALAAVAGLTAGGMLLRMRWLRARAAPPAEPEMTQRRAPRKAVEVRRKAASGKPSAPMPASPKAGRACFEIVEGGQGTIEVLEPIIRMGRDPNVVQAVFADRSVSRLHARLAEVGDGVFHLYDEGSTSGTWVNYEQVSIAGVPLKNGDLVNLGRVQLRFRLRSAADAGPPPVPTATPAPHDIPTGPTTPVKPPGR